MIEHNHELLNQSTGPGAEPLSSHDVTFECEDDQIWICIDGQRRGHLYISDGLIGRNENAKYATRAIVNSVGHDGRFKDAMILGKI